MKTFIGTLITALALMTLPIIAMAGTILHESFEGGGYESSWVNEVSQIEIQTEIHIPKNMKRIQFCAFGEPTWIARKFWQHGYRLDNLITPNSHFGVNCYVFEKEDEELINLRKTWGEHPSGKRDISCKRCGEHYREGNEHKCKSNTRETNETHGD